MLAIVPARAGSKRLPGKNTKMLGAQSLISRTIEAALESEVFTNIVFSSNDAEAINIAKDYDVDIQCRSDDLSGDDVRVVDVVRNVMSTQSYLQEDSAAVLFVTSPFRTSADIVKCKEVFDQGRDSCLTITKYPVPPQFALKIDEGVVSPAQSYEFFHKTTSKQKLETYFYPNYAVQMFKRSVVEKFNGFVGENCGFVEMQPERSIDIDTPFDYLVAEAVHRAGIVP